MLPDFLVFAAIKGLGKVVQKLVKRLPKTSQGFLTYLPKKAQDYLKGLNLQKATQDIINNLPEATQVLLDGLAGGWATNTAINTIKKQWKFHKNQTEKLLNKTKDLYDDVMDWLGSLDPVSKNPVGEGKVHTSIFDLYGTCRWTGFGF
jgi:hypothetical protein